MRYEYNPLVRYICIICIYIGRIYVKFDIILIFFIHTNFARLFVIIKTRPPTRCPLLKNPPSSSRNDIVQDEEHGANIENQVNDLME